MSREFRLGIFVIGTLLILALGVFLIGSKQFLFSSTYHLQANFKTVAGLNEGAEVRVGGIHKGTVKHIDLPARPDQKVTVVMELGSDTRNIVKRDSVASIKTEGVLGDKYVEISFGSERSEKVRNGDTIPGEPPLEVSSLVKKADQILDTTSEALRNIDQATNNLNSVSAKINGGKGTVGALINDKRIYEQANAAAAEARAGATAFHENMEALKHNFLLRGFFRKRGYEDPGELTRHEIPRLPPEPYVKRFSYDAKQIFHKPDMAELKNQKALSEAGKFLQENRYGLAVVAAYAGPQGDTEKDHVLTQAQSAVVRDYLAQNFKLDDTRLKTIGLGKAGDKGKVEILVYAGGPS